LSDIAFLFFNYYETTLSNVVYKSKIS